MKLLLPLMFVYVQAFAGDKLPDVEDNLAGFVVHLADQMKLLQKRNQVLGDRSRLQEKQINELLLKTKMQDKHIMEQFDKTLGCENVCKNQNVESSYIAFTAYVDRDHAYNDGQVVQFEVALENHGGYYNEENGTFLCAHTGYYLFFVAVYTRPGSIMRVGLYNNDQFLVSTCSRDHESHDASSTMIVTLCYAGDFVVVKARGDDLEISDGDHRHSSFTGSLLRVV